jgi:hypothetical protein
VSRAAKHFFIPVVHSPLGGVGDVVALELSPRGSRARSHGTRGSARAHLGREARSGAEGHMVPTHEFRYRACMQGYPVFRVPTTFRETYWLRFWTRLQHDNTTNDFIRQMSSDIEVITLQITNMG